MPIPNGWQNANPDHRPESAHSNRQTLPMTQNSGSTSTENTSKAANPESELRAALTAYETSVTTPVVSGELLDWVENVQKTWAEASNQVRRQLAELHPRQYQQIAQQDAGLLPEVEKLKAEDEAIEKCRSQLDHTVMRVAQHVPGVEPDEGKADSILKMLVDDSVSFVTRVRKQEVAVQTWFVEAFNRERGGGDRP